MASWISSLGIYSFPTYRGFDTFYGYWNAWTDYFLSNYNLDENIVGHDLRSNEDTLYLEGSEGDFSIYRFRDEAIRIIEDSVDSNIPFFMYLAWQSSHTPSECPAVYSQMYADDTTNLRQFDQAQTTAMDDAIHALVTTLKETNLWQNTILIFSSDNGGAATIGDNFPLRGYKKTIFDGGLRVPAFVSGGYLNEDRRGSNIGSDGSYFHVIDWYPTLLEMAGIEPSYAKSQRKLNTDIEPEWEGAQYNVPLDGNSMWQLIQYGTSDISFTDRLIYLDTYVNEGTSVNGSVRFGRFKYQKGLGTFDDSDGDDGYLWGDNFADISQDAHLWGSNFANTDVDNSLGCDLNIEPVNEMCFESASGCLFDLVSDPCEMIDLSQDESYKDVLNMLQDKLAYVGEIMPTDLAQDGGFYMDVDEGEDGWLPKNFDDVWTPWQNYEDADFERVLFSEYNRMYEPIVTYDNEDGVVLGRNAFGPVSTSLWIFVCGLAVVFVILALQCFNWCLVKRILKINKLKNANEFREVDNTCYGSI